MLEVSQNKIIREMDASELELEYTRLLSGISGSLSVITDFGYLNLIRNQYRQITGHNISDSIFQMP